MQAQGSRIILYSVATPAEEDQLCQQLVEIGHTHIIRLHDRDHLEKLVLDTPFSTLVLLLTDAAHSQSAVLDISHPVKMLPVIGLFSRNSSLCGQRIVKACNEVATWPCSKQELDYRIRKLTTCCRNQDLDHSLFVKMNILGNSPEFLLVLDKVCKIRKCDAPVFIDGETGTGKELIARAIHYLSERREKPFIAANCGAFPDQLIENEFFGHAKGAYTDARESSDGLIAQAEGGTLPC
jgi:DNA-binding NtrC family response regulator